MSNVPMPALIALLVLAAGATMTLFIAGIRSMFGQNAAPATDALVLESDSRRTAPQTVESRSSRRPPPAAHGSDRDLPSVDELTEMARQRGLLLDRIPRRRHTDEPPTRSRWIDPEPDPGLVDLAEREADTAEADADAPTTPLELRMPSTRLRLDDPPPQRVPVASQPSRSQIGGSLHVSQLEADDRYAVPQTVVYAEESATPAKAKRPGSKSGRNVIVVLLAAFAVVGLLGHWLLTADPTSPSSPLIAQWLLRGVVSAMPIIVVLALRSNSIVNAINKRYKPLEDDIDTDDKEAKAALKARKAEELGAHSLITFLMTPAILVTVLAIVVLKLRFHAVLWPGSLL